MPGVKKFHLKIISVKILPDDAWCLKFEIHPVDNEMKMWKTNTD